MIAYPGYIPEQDIANRDYQLKQDRPLSEYFNYLKLNDVPAIIETQNDEIFCFEAEPTRFYFKELLRADFSGNGYEEILCMLGQQAIGGTLGFSSVILLQKHSPDDLVTYVYYPSPSEE